MKIFLFWISLTAAVFSQTITFDEFLDLSSGVLDTAKASKIISYFPERFQITALDYGDVSGDGLTDFAIAVDPLGNRGHEVFIFVFCDYPDEYKVIYHDTLEYVITPLEIGFSIANENFYITHKEYQLNWTIKGFSFFKEEFSEVDIYHTDTVKIKRNSAIGKETYINYHDLSSFIGYYDLNTVAEKAKYKYYTIPAYDYRRNVYGRYPKKLRLNKALEFSADSVDTGQFDYGDFEVVKDGEYIRLIARIDASFIKRNTSINLKTYFDLSGAEFNYNKKKKTKTFRDSLDNDIFGMEVSFAGDSITGTSFYNRERVSDSDIRKIKLLKYSGNKFEINLFLPAAFFYRKGSLDTIKSFIAFEFNRNGIVKELKNTSGSLNNPSTYGYMLFIKDGDFLGIRRNKRFSELINKLYSNGVLREKENL